MTPSSTNQETRKRPGGSDISPRRGSYFTLKQASEAYPAFTLRLLRRLVEERRIPFSRVGRCIVLAEADIEAYVESQRVEPPKPDRHWGVAS